MSSKWALILGASSGFGGATSVELAKARLRHLRRALRPALDAAERGGVQDAVKAAGQEAVFFNINAADPDKRAAALDTVREKLGDDGYVHVLHALAGVRHAAAVHRRRRRRSGISQKQMDMTLDVMAHSLVYWAQDMATREAARARTAASSR